MGAQQAERLRAIESALLDFQRTPGRYKIALNEPAVLFAAMRDVLQLAAGREGAQTPANVAQAARFFVRAALLQPGADHYTLLGLTRDADAAAIKDRYRALMRLVHPDFAASAGADWPTDAATRINQAYEVLSSGERRRAYDETFAPAASRPPASAQREIAPVPPPTRPARRLGESRRVLRRLAAGFGALGAIALAGLWAATAPNDRELLVQRASTRVATGAVPAVHDVADPVEWPGNAAAVQAPTDAPEPLVAALSASAPVAAPAAAAALPVTLAGALPSLLATSASAMPAPAPAGVQVAQGGASADAPAAPAPRALTAPAPAPSAAPAAGASLNMAAVQPVLTRLLQDIESGWGDTLMAGLDRDLRRTPGAQTLARQLDTLCDGVRPVKIARVDFRGESQGGRFVVSGQVVLDVRDSLAPTRQLALLAEFTERDGAPVLTRLATP